MKYFNNYYGLRAENYFLSKMNEIGLKAEYKDAWFDFLVNNQKVEIKSCQLSIKQPKGQNKKITYRSGRFHFTKKENREKQFKENIWVCFILRYNNEFIILGFIRAKELKKKKSVCIHKLRELKLFSLESWVCEVNK